MSKQEIFDEKTQQKLEELKKEMSNVKGDAKAQALIDSDGVTVIDEKYAKVRSSSGDFYEINYIDQKCRCPGYMKGGHKCYHIRAVNIVVAEMQEQVRTEPVTFANLVGVEPEAKEQNVHDPYDLLLEMEVK